MLRHPCAGLPRAALLLVGFLALTGRPSPGQSVHETVRAEYSGESGYASVAQLDQFVRWPGNSGFDASIDHIIMRLEAAGFGREEEAGFEHGHAAEGVEREAGAAGFEREAEAVRQSGEQPILTYRVEHYPLATPAWEPLDAWLAIEGDGDPILAHATNRNALARNSFSTPPAGIVAELVDLGDGSALAGTDVRGKIVLVDGSLSRIFRSAVIQGGAAGVLAYSLPDYLEPEIHRSSIQFRSIPFDSTTKGWGMALSFEARDRLRLALAEGPVWLRASTRVAWTSPGIERTVVADIRGASHPQERFVFSAHVQENGANDNASGVGAQLEMARVAASLVQSGGLRPSRTITFLWGDEIRSTGRYVSQDSLRAGGIHWGMSLDMVGEDTQKTGGTFLIEKMPDPSAIWTRGEDRHTDWGSRPLSKEEMTPHYFNDFVLNRALEQAAETGWVVRTNPFEGGSDHVPFLRAGIPGLLLWHFTDQFYHTDGDRIDMVSADELANVGITALTTALVLTSADGGTARRAVREVEAAALDRLRKETVLGLAAIESGDSAALQREILGTWAEWYRQALASTEDIEIGGSSTETLDAVREAQKRVQSALVEALAAINR